MVELGADLAGLVAVATRYSPDLVNRICLENVTAFAGVFTAIEGTMAFVAPIGQSLLVALTGDKRCPWWS